MSDQDLNFDNKNLDRVKTNAMLNKISDGLLDIINSNTLSHIKNYQYIYDPYSFKKQHSENIKLFRYYCTEMKKNIDKLFCPMCQKIMFDPVSTSDHCIIDASCAQKFVHIQSTNYVKNPITNHSIIGSFKKVRYLKDLIINLIIYTNLLDQWILDIEPYDIICYDLADHLQIIKKLRPDFTVCKKSRSYLYESLSNFIKTGDENRAIKLVNRIDINALYRESRESRDKRTNLRPILIEACSESMSRLAMIIIDRGYKYYNIPDVDENTALIIACKEGMEDVAIKLLMLPGIDCRNQDQDGLTALGYAVIKKMTNVVMMMIDEKNSKKLKIDVNHQDIHGCSVLMYACMRRLNDVALFLIDKYKNLNYNASDSDGETALLIAISKGSTQVASKLLDINDINFVHVNNECENAYLLAQRNITHGMGQIIIKIKEKYYKLWCAALDNDPLLLDTSCSKLGRSCSVKSIDTYESNDDTTQILDSEISDKINFKNMTVLEFITS